MNADQIDNVWTDALNMAGEMLGEILTRTAGEGEPVSTVPVVADRRTRRTQIDRERMRRAFGRYTVDGWQTRENAAQAGPYDPADITEYLAKCMLEVGTAYVRKHSGPTAPNPLTPDMVDEVVARAIFYVLTRDYSKAPLYRGQHARAFWGALKLYRRTAWIGESALAQKEARRKQDTEGDIHRRIGVQGPKGDNPAAIVSAIEEAERRGLRAHRKNQRGKYRTTRREARTFSVGTVNQADARSVLTPTDDRPAYRPDRPTPQPTAGEGLACPWSPGCRRDTVTQAN